MQFCMKYGAFCIQAPVTDTPPCPSPASLIGFLFGCGFGFTGITKRKVAPVDFLGQLKSWEVRKLGSWEVGGVTQYTA